MDASVLIQMMLPLFLIGLSYVNGQLGYAQFQNAMPGSNANNMYAPRYGSAGGYQNGFSFNPEVGVVGPPRFGGGYEKLGVGQYPFVDPETYWFLAGVSAASNNYRTFLPVLSALIWIPVSLFLS